MPEESQRQYEATLPGPLRFVDRWLSRIESFILAAGVLLMAINTCSNVIGRFVFGQSLFFSEELNRILIVLITFAGISYAARQGRHIRMSAIYDALPFMGRKVLMIVICVVTSITTFALFYYSLVYIHSVYESGRVMSSLRIGVFWIYLWVPIGFFFTGMQYALTAIKNITAKDIYLSTHVLDGYEETEVEV